MKVSTMLTTEPILFMVSAPSGAGKTSLIARLLQEFPTTTLTVSYTTRAPREGEVDGVAYRFVSTKVFEDMIKKEDFAEYAKVHQHYYGTPKSELSNYLNGRGDVIAEIDWQGARSIRALYPEALSLFISPPSITELENRLRKRGKDSDSVIKSRVAKAQEEMSHIGEFDFAIMNDEFEKAYTALKTIYLAGHYRVIQKK